MYWSTISQSTVHIMSVLTISATETASSVCLSALNVRNALCLPTKVDFFLLLLSTDWPPFWRRGRRKRILSQFFPRNSFHIRFDLDIPSRITAGIPRFLRPFINVVYNSLLFASPLILLSTDYGRPERKKPSLHGRKFTPTPKFLVTAKAYFVCHFSPIFSDIFYLCLHWVSVVRG